MGHAVQCHDQDFIATWGFRRVVLALREDKAINDELNKLKGGQLELFRWQTYLISKSYGVDFNQEAVEITKLSLWLKTATCK